MANKFLSCKGLLKWHFFSPPSLTIRSYWSDKATFKFLLRLCHSYLKVTHSTIKLIISMHLKASHVTNIWWSQPTSVDVLVFFPCLMSVDLCLPPACVTERFCSGFGLFVLPSGLVPGSIVIACGASTLLHFQHPLYLLSFKSFLLNCSWTKTKTKTKNLGRTFVSYETVFFRYNQCANSINMYLYSVALKFKV